MKDAENKLIVISGGGSGGPSTAPLALAVAFRNLDASARFLFIGNAPKLEKDLFGDIFQSLGADYLALPAGKWRRYFSLFNILDFFKILSGFIQSYFLFRRLHPALIISAGSFASVPVVWAGHFCGAKILIHQQDVRPGLANRLMRRAADRVSVAFPKSLADYGNRAVLIGNPSLSSVSVADQERVRRKFNLVSSHPLLLVTGGGTGALALNRLFFEALRDLPADWQIIHQTGIGKGEGAPSRFAYQVIETLSHEDFKGLLSLADIVVSRAGLGAMTELSILAKPCVLLPIPHSHQEDNAAYFAEKKAAIVLNQEGLKAAALAAELRELWADKNRRQLLSNNIQGLLPVDAAEKGAALIQELLKEG